MADDVIVNKAGSIERCLRRITEEYGGDRSNLFDNQTKQDASASATSPCMTTPA